MGLFSGIKKLFKKVFKGIKTVFKKVLKFVGKIAGSKWGKILLIAAAVFTGGMAIAAGFQGFTGTAGSFLTKFVAGAKEFVTALANPMSTAKKMFGGAEAAVGQAGSVASSAEAATGVAQGAAPGELLGSAGSAVQTTAEPMNVLANAGKAAAPIIDKGTQFVGANSGGVMEATGGLLKAGAKSAVDFAKSAGGGVVLAGALKGFAEGKQQDELLKEEERVRRYYDQQWRDPEQLAALDASVRDVDVPGGYIQRAQRVSRFLNDRQYEYPSSVVNPEQVANYARSPVAG